MAGRMNWAAATSRQRIARNGGESVNGQAVAPRAARPGRKTDRQMPKRSGPTLDQPIVVDKWWKDRSGRAVYVRLSTFEGHNLVDVRTWFTDAQGISQPGKGFACTVKHLPRLVAALTKALAKSRELGLLNEASE
jgi:hypothetical protein